MKLIKTNLKEFIEFESQLKNRIKDIIVYLIQNDGYNPCVPSEIYNLDFTYDFEPENKWHACEVRVYWTEHCHGETYHESYSFPIEYICDDVNFVKIEQELKAEAKHKAEIAAKKAAETKKRNEELKKVKKERKEKELYLKLKEKYRGRLS